MSQEVRSVFFRQARFCRVFQKELCRRLLCHEQGQALQSEPILRRLPQLSPEAPCKDLRLFPHRRLNFLFPYSAQA